jgi:hypothetical protein
MKDKSYRTPEYKYKNGTNWLQQALDRGDMEQVAAIRRRGREQQAKARKKNPLKYLVSYAKYRAKKRNIEFSITESDLTVPHLCPILDIPLEFGGNLLTSPSIDRIDNTKGYVKGNVRIISQRANALKSSLTKEQITRLYHYVHQPSV